MSSILRALVAIPPIERPLTFVALVFRKLFRTWLAEYDSVKYFTDRGLPVVRERGMYRVAVPRTRDLASHVIWLRRHSSDFATWKQCLVEEQYSTACDMLSHRQSPKTLVIIDAGANVGCASLYFARRFPTALVIAIEPDAGNFGMLQRNVAANQLTNVRCLRAALWSEETPLVVGRGFRDGREWATTVHPSTSTSASVRGISLEAVLKEMGLKSVDLLKVDIEGAEEEVFRDVDTVSAWIDSTKVIAIELHRDAGAELISKCLGAFGFTGRQRGEITVYRRHDHMVAANATPEGIRDLPNAFD